MHSDSEQQGLYGAQDTSTFSTKQIVEWDANEDHTISEEHFYR
jgi:hypothetical protein